MKIPLVSKIATFLFRSVHESEYKDSLLHPIRLDDGNYYFLIHSHSGTVVVTVQTVKIKHFIG